jgi:hypothetical protein
MKPHGAKAASISASLLAVKMTISCPRDDGLFALAENDVSGIR